MSQEWNGAGKMVAQNSPNTPQVFRTEDKLCSFVRRVLPGGQVIEMNNAFHDDVVILAFSGSAWLSRQAGRTYEETPGCVVLRDAGQVFNTKTLYSDEKNGSQCREIHIPKNNMAHLLSPDDPFDMSSFDFSNPVISSTKLHERLIHTHAAFEEGECSLMRSTCLGMLLQDIAGATNNRSIDDNRRNCPRRYRDVVEYMRQHYDEEITLQSLSRISKTNQFVLFRQFREEYGVTPHQYLRTYRVNQAMNYIKQGAKLADVAQLCGFSDQSHMNRQFKRTVGVSPGKVFMKTLG
ncbi:MAG: AraC family transcriptional regulator [Telmatospirillum sp.]|nr:AraC family transcriptional regulator [Telmatospirillum sp.]